MGFASALFLIVLSITGLALNHTERLGLDSIQIHNSWLLSKYGMAGADHIQSYRIHETDTLSYLDGQLFYNNTLLINAGKPVTILEGNPITVIATSNQLIYLTPGGDMIEKIDHTQLPYTTLNAVGQSIDQSPVLVTDNGNWTPDKDWLEFKPYQESYTVEPFERIQLQQSEINAILQAFQGSGVSLYRVLLDLHSGRLFGWGGRTLMDLSAIAILLLVASGISGKLRKSRKQNQSLEV